MRKHLLIAVAAAAMMSVAALPSASLASTAARANTAVVHTCPPGNHDPQYCERCPDSQAAAQNTANLGAAAALAAANALKDSSTSITFTFTPTACGTFHFELSFGVSAHDHLNYVGVAVAVATTKAGVPITITATLSTFARAFIAHQAARHDRLNFKVAVTETNKHGTHPGATTLFGHISF